MDHLFGMSLKCIHSKVGAHLLESYEILSEVYLLSIDYRDLTFSQGLCLLMDDDQLATYGSRISAEECNIFRCQVAIATLLLLERHDLRCRWFLHTPIHQIYQALIGIAGLDTRGTLREQLKYIEAQLHDSLDMSFNEQTTFQDILPKTYSPLHNCARFYQAKEVCELLEVLIFDLNRRYLECRHGKAVYQVIREIAIPAEDDDFFTEWI